MKISQFLSKNLLLSFFFVCTVLSAPLFYLIIANQKDYEEKYQFNQKEIDGIILIKKLVPAFEKNVLATDFKLNQFVNPLDFEVLFKDEQVEKSQKIQLEVKNILKNMNQNTREDLSEKFFNPIIRSVANYSNLILDPDLDTYYLMDVGVLKIPNLLQYLSKDSDYTSIERLLKNIQSEMNEITYSLNTALENVNPENEQYLIKKSQILKNLKETNNEIDMQLSGKKRFDLKTIVKHIDTLENESISSLSILLHLKSVEMKAHNRVVLSWTMGCWLIGALIGFILFYKILQIQSEAFAQITNQRQKIQETEKLSTLGELASGIIHEIKNPLTIIDFEANNLQKIVQTENFNLNKVLEKLKKISEMALRINKITKMVTIYSRNSQNDPINSESIIQTLNEVVYLTKLKADKFDIKISIDSEDFNFDCRRIQIEQVIINMINNSIDAIEKNTEKWVKVTARILNKNNASYVQIEVEDSGQGISKQTTEKMFESFYTTKESGKGTGFGLSVSKNIVEAHNGRIYYDQNSKNTKFVIEIPQRNT